MKTTESIVDLLLTSATVKEKMNKVVKIWQSININQRRFW